MAARYALGPAGSAHENVQPSLRFSNPLWGSHPSCQGTFHGIEKPTVMVGYCNWRRVRDSNPR